MRERLTAIAGRGTNAWNSFTSGQKAVTIVAILALAIGGYFFATWAGKPQYAPLFTNLAGADASSIVDRLTADGTPYELADGGATILVPKDKVYAERISMSSAGLPAQGEAGYALLDKQGVMTSDFMQQVTYRRALEGELGKTIRAIDGVTAATVHLAIPEKDVFADNQQKPTASVLVATGTNTLTSDKVQAIVHLIASSVDGLDPSDVTVVGADGKVLSTGGDYTGGGGVGGDAASQTSAYETRLGNSLTTMLDTVLGPNHAAVQVTADLDFNSSETKTQQYVADPTTPPLSETKKNEAYTGNGSSTGGVLGPDNIQVPAGAAANGNGAYQQSTETRNNAVGMVTTTTKSAPGAVKKLSVAVIVDSTAAKVDPAQLQQLISSAVGLDPKRGDMIAVSSMAFDQTATKANAAAQAAATQAGTAQVIQGYIKMGVIALVILILLIVATVAARRKRKADQAKREADASAALEEMQNAIDVARAKLSLDGGGAGMALEGGPGGDIDGISRETRQRELSQLVAQQPDEVAQLLRGWLADRRS
jgi:flagellar M-ring protein FliF